MKLRTQKRLLYLLGTSLIAGALASVLYVVLNPVQTPELPLQQSEIVSADVVQFDEAEFKILLNKKLQGPLVDPPPAVTKKTPNKPNPNVAVQLPGAIQLQGILYSKDASIAVIQSSQGVVRCGTGDQVEGAMLKEISANEVVFEFRGKEFRRTIKD